MFDTVSLDEGRGALAIIDQTLLPNREELIYLTEPEEIRDAIYRLKVRGAPAIGVAAAIGYYLAAEAIARELAASGGADGVSGSPSGGAGRTLTGSAVGSAAGGASGSQANNAAGFPANGAGGVPVSGACASRLDLFFTKLGAAKDLLNSARPTAVNLSWALNRMERAALNRATPSDKGEESLSVDIGADRGVESLPADRGADRGEESLLAIVARLKTECLAIADEDARVCAEIGRRGLELLKPGMGLLTHCNAGRLATASRYGTATAPIYLGHERGYGFQVFCDETRPLLQGARLTAYELCSAGVDTTLLCDNMAPSLMSAGRIDAVLVGCDRVAANGDTANKIGTSYVAIAARHYGIPFYVCAPSSTIDFTCAGGQSIVIEQRPAAEVTDMWYADRMAPENAKVFNPAFDVTDANLITAIVTEYSVARPPYRESLAALINKR